MGMIQMQDNEINYEAMVHKALRDVVKNVLQDAAKNGLSGDHHFYICFATPHPLTQIPDTLRDEYPEDMTIVIQHEYWDLMVDEKTFSITLCFDEIHECIVVPFDAIISFLDPSVKFALQFNPIYPEEYDVLETADVNDKKEPKLKDDNAENAAVDDNVVVIDFSKRK